MTRYAKVTAQVWVDLEKMARDEADAGFDMGDDPVEDARYLVQQRLAGMIAITAFRTAAKPAHRTPVDTER